MEDKFIKWGEEAEELSEPRSNSEGNNSIPNKKSDDGMFGDTALFPGDFGVSDKSYNDGDSCGDEVG